jgi:glycosyltransferase involved in cell wall biosynthesis
MKKILIFVGNLRAGGTERQIVELLKGLENQSEYEVMLAVIDNSIDYDDIYKLNIELRIIERKKNSKIDMLRKMYAIAKEFDPDVIHGWLYTVAFFSSFIALLLRKRFINSMIRYAKPIRRFSRLWWYAKLSFPISSYVIANSRAGLKAHNLIENKKYKVVYNGVDFARFNQNFDDKYLHKELGLDKESFIIGMVARFGDSKDYESLVDVAEYYQKRKNRIIFVSIGKGINFDRIKRKVDVLNLGNFFLLGYRNDVEKCISSFDIGILLNNTNGHAEGLSNSITEYMALGKPVIATNAGGTPELISNNENGFLVDAFNINQIIGKIDFLYNDAELRKIMGQKSKKVIFNNFTLKNMVDSYMDLYEK